MKKIIRGSCFLGGLAGYFAATMFILLVVLPLTSPTSPEKVLSLGEPWIFIYTHFHTHLLLVAMVPFVGTSLLLLVGTYIVARNGGRL